MLADPQRDRITSSTIFYLHSVGAARYHHVVLSSPSTVKIFCTEKYEKITDVDMRMNNIF
jgi:hypothetical protein